MYHLSPDEACKIKRVYLQKQSAKHAASRQPALRLHPYRCPRCNLWHLSSADAKQREINRAMKRRANDKRRI